MRLTWLALGLLSSCARIPLDTEETDTGTETTPTIDTESPPTVDTGPVVVECGAPSMRGAWWDDHPFTGLSTTTTAPMVDAGLAAVRSAGLAATGVTALDTPLSVSGAVVTFTGFRPSGTDVLEVWVADSSGGLFLRFVTVPESVGLKPGDIVDFTVNVVSNFGGLAQVTNQTTGYPDFDVITEGITDLEVRPDPIADVWVVDAATTPLTVAEHGHAIVDIYGKIVEVENADCGDDGEVCYTYEYAEDRTLTFRSSSSFIKPNDCIQYFGPLGAFNALQIDATNFDWHRSY